MWRAELLYPKLLFSCADFPGNTGQIARAEQGGRSCFAKRMECVELAPAVRCVARFDSGSKLHALHTLRAVRFRLRRAEDRRALPAIVSSSGGWSRGPWSRGPPLAVRQYAPGRLTVRLQHQQS